MKSQKNEHGIYSVTETVTHEKDHSRYLEIDIANCKDGYRAVCNLRWGGWWCSSPIMDRNKVFKQKLEAIIYAIGEEIRYIKRDPSRQDLLVFLRTIHQREREKEKRFKQLEMF